MSKIIQVRLWLQVHAMTLVLVTLMVVIIGLLIVFLRESRTIPTFYEALRPPSVALCPGQRFVLEARVERMPPGQYVVVEVWRPQGSIGNSLSIKRMDNLVVDRDVADFTFFWPREMPDSATIVPGTRWEFVHSLRHAGTDATDFIIIPVEVPDQCETFAPQ